MLCIDKRRQQYWTIQLASHLHTCMFLWLSGCCLLFVTDMHSERPPAAYPQQLLTSIHAKCRDTIPLLACWLHDTRASCFCWPSGDHDGCNDLVALIKSIYEIYSFTAVLSPPVQCNHTPYTKLNNLVLLATTSAEHHFVCSALLCISWMS